MGCSEFDSKTTFENRLKYTIIIIDPRTLQNAELDVQIRLSYYNIQLYGIKNKHLKSIIIYH